MRISPIIVLLIASSVSHAGTVLDQAQDTHFSSTSSFATGHLERSQTFTIGESGVLSSIDIRVYSRSQNNPDFVLSIYSVENGVPSEESVLSVSLPPDAIPYVSPEDEDVMTWEEELALFQWVSIDISAFNLQVQVGEQWAYGIVGAGAAESVNSWYRINSGYIDDGVGPYSAGESFRRSLDPTNYSYQFYPTWSETEHNDMAFRTYVTIIDKTAIIDVDPWKSVNEVQPDSEALLNVAVMGSNTANGDATDFDVTQVDPGTLKLGIGQAQNIAPAPFLADFDGDSNTDAAFLFETSNSGISCGDTDITLSGETFSGEFFIGADMISTIECVSGGCHP